MRTIRKREETKLPAPVYPELLARYRAFIVDGHCKSGDQLIGTRQLAALEDVARSTCERIYNELEREGLVRRVRGHGTYVTDRTESDGE